MRKKIDNWFADWFDSYHYHLLYQHRNDTEAEEFIGNILNHLNLEKGAKVLDLACGKGRHALQVHQLGYDVMGVDLSEESISHASEFEEEGLEFRIGDMRELDLDAEFDLTLNLFTSFGYFQKEGENKAVLAGLSKHLKKDGRIILDYLNVKKVEKELPNQKDIQRGAITFKTKKELLDGFIVKDIHFSENEMDYHYQEYVKHIELDDFKSYFDEFGLEIEKVFGNYQLEAFNEASSERLIMVAKFK